ERLNGATFELRQGNKVVATGTTENDGTIKFEDLDYGDYQLVETKAPNGYSLLRNPIDVTINEDNHNATVTVDNYKNGWELPKTGGIGTTLFTIIGLSLMGAAVYMMIRRRKEDTV